MTLSHRRRLVRHDLLHNRPLQQSLPPRPVCGVLLWNLHAFELLTEKPGRYGVPRDEHQVRNRALLAHQVLLPLQGQVEDVENADDLVLIALDGTGELLGVEFLEPRCLAEVRALAADLEGDPLLDVVLFRKRVVAESAFLVVGIGEVLDDCGGFPERDAGVGVFDGGDAAVGVDLLERWLLQVGHVHVLGLVGDAELFEDYGYLPWIGARGCGGLSCQLN
jgi:hypothetical protein